jgi:hypothetical protein
MPAPSYPTARAISRRVREHFAKHGALARAHGTKGLSPLPDANAIERIADAAFWASLRREEGVTPTVSLAYLPPSATSQPLLFERPLPMTAAALARLAPAVERPGIHLGVWRDRGGEFRVWGTARRIPPLCFVIEVVASGLLVIKHRGESFGKFVNVAVLEGEEIKFIDEATARVPDCPGVVASLLGLELPAPLADAGNVLIQLAASMRAHRRGGALIMIPASNSTWEESIVHPVLYGVAPLFAELATLVKDGPQGVDEYEWQQDLRRAVDALAGLTAVDGATLITDRYELMAFGAKIARRRGQAQVERVMMTEPIEGRPVTTVNPYQLGGTRHLSAAQFVHDQRDATALVASQDGRFTIFKWSDREDLVHAHRVEALLL